MARSIYVRDDNISHPVPPELDALPRAVAVLERELGPRQREELRQQREWLRQAQINSLFRHPPPTARPAPVVPWLKSAAFFIPKSIREPFVGDLREDVVEMMEAGQSRAAVWWRVCSQIVVLAVKTWLSIRK
jgi:hypothetical protein